jgi:hypothetical protein
VTAGTFLVLLLARHSPARETLPDLVVAATLRDLGPASPPACGVFHFAVVMKYTVVRVDSGAYRPKDLYAVHGCPEQTRREYGGADAGDLTAFRVGDVHRLVLRSETPPGIGVIDVFGKTKAPRYWVVRADAAMAPHD